MYPLHNTYIRRTLLQAASLVFEKKSQKKTHSAVLKHPTEVAAAAAAARAYYVIIYLRTYHIHTYIQYVSYGYSTTHTLHLHCKKYLVSLSKVLACQDDGSILGEGIRQSLFFQ